LSPNEKFVTWVKERNGFYDNQTPRFIPIAKIAPHFLYVIDIVIRIKSVWVLVGVWGGWDFPLDTEVPWDTAEITMSSFNTEYVQNHFYKGHFKESLTIFLDTIFVLH